MSQAWKLNQPIDFRKHLRANGQPEEDDARQDLEGQSQISLESENPQKESTWLP